MDGFVDSLTDGDVEVDGRFARQTATIVVRLTRDRPGQVLAVARGHVYGEKWGRLRPISGARVEVVAGSGTGASTLTNAAGEYELTGIPPGYAIVQVRIRGYVAGESATNLWAGDNRVSILIDLPSGTAASRL
jgi:hypothetical protein